MAPQADDAQGQTHRRSSNDIRQAVALQYEPGAMAAPQIVATGRGEVAERIIALAKEAGVPVKEDPQLVTLLAKLDLDAFIPPELYEVVAHLLAFVYQLDRDFGKARSQLRITDP